MNGSLPPEHQRILRRYIQEAAFPLLLANATLLATITTALDDYLLQGADEEVRVLRLAIAEAQDFAGYAD